MGIRDWFKRAPPAATPADSVRVPAGHTVHIHRITREPAGGEVVVCDGGLILVRVPDVVAARAVERLGSAARADLARRREAPLIAQARGGIDALFAPRHPRIERGGIDALWLVSGDAVAALAAPDSGLERALDAVGPARAQVAFLERTAPARDALATRLAAHGVDLRAPQPDGAVLAEVRRPEGVVLNALLDGGAPDGGDDDALRAVLTLAVDDPDAPLAPLYAALATRERALFVLASVSRTGPPTFMTRSWPGLGPALAAYPDAAWAAHAAAEMNLRAGAFVFAAMAPQKLFAFVRANHLALLLGVVPGTRAARYVRVPDEVLDGTYDPARSNSRG